MFSSEEQLQARGGNDQANNKVRESGNQSCMLFDTFWFAEFGERRNVPEIQRKNIRIQSYEEPPFKN